jgi:uncharacterized membrane protein (Fun14 family)
MNLQAWQSIIFTFGEGFILGLIVGYSTRKLNKLIAAFVGLFLLAINLSYLAGMFKIDTTIPLIGQLIDKLLEILPFSIENMWNLLKPILKTFTKIPFLTGLVFGGFVGFKLV